MDKHARALILQLCSCAGAMMEDASVPAVTFSGIEDSQIPAALGNLARQAGNISALLAAATALAELFDVSQ